MRKKLVALLLTSALSLGLVACGGSDADVSVEPETTEAIETVETLPVLEETTSEDEVEEQKEAKEIEKSKKYTDAKSVVENIKTFDNGEFSLVFSIEAESPMSAEEQSDFEALGNDVTNAVNNINFNFEIMSKIDKALSHVQGTLKLKISGISMEIPMEAYVDSSADLVYESEYDMMSGVSKWKTTSIEDSSTDFLELSTIPTYLIDKILGIENFNEVAKFVELDHDYKITIPASALDDSGSDIVGSVTGDLGSDIDTSNLDLNLVILVNKDDMKLKSMQYDVGDSDLSDDEIKITNLIFAINIIKYGNTSVVIPESVKNAVTSDSSDVNTDSATSSNLQYTDESLAKVIWGTSDLDAQVVFDFLYETYPYFEEVGYTKYPSDISKPELNELHKIILEYHSKLEVYTEEDLINYLNYIKSASATDVCTLLLLGDLDVLSGEYRTALQEAIVEANLVDSDGYNLYMKVCGLN